MKAVTVRMLCWKTERALHKPLFLWPCQLQEKKKKQEEAFAVFRSNAKKFPDYWTSHVGMARVYSGQGDFDKAVKEIQTALTTAPDSNKGEPAELCEAVAVQRRH